jgi:hypothetical protein
VYVWSGIGVSRRHCSSNAKSSPGYLTDPGELFGIAILIARLTHLLRSTLDGVEVTDETGVAGAFGFIARLANGQ